jgi:hypothetical protein
MGAGGVGDHSVRVEHINRHLFHASRRPWRLAVCRRGKIIFKIFCNFDYKKYIVNNKKQEKNYIGK